VSTFTRRQARNRGLQGGGALGRQRLGPPALELAVDAPHAGGRAAGSRHHGAEAKRKLESRRERCERQRREARTEGVCRAGGRGSGARNLYPVRSRWLAHGELALA
jgi:hypothetical protein